MDGSAEHACFVLGVSLHYADTFSQCGHFFGAHTVQNCLQWTQCSAFLCLFAVTNQSLPLTGHFDSVASSFAVHHLPHGGKQSLYGGPTCPSCQNSKCVSNEEHAGLSIPLLPGRNSR